MDKNGAITKELRYLLEARYTLFWVVTHEERRAERTIAALALELGYQVRYWDCETGATDLHGEPVPLMQISPEGLPVSNDWPATSPRAVFGAVRARETRELWIMRDLHQHLDDDPGNTRALRNLARDLQDDVDIDKTAAVVVVSPSADIPIELRGSSTVIEWPFPNREEIREILAGAEEAQEIAGAPAIKDEEASAIVEAAIGLAADDLAGAFARSIAELGRVDPAAVAAHKKRIIERERTLAWWPPDPRGLDAIGGLELLKSWLRDRSRCLEAGAREFGLRAPRGLLLAGVPGCGKSATAKAIPAAWGNSPLLRLDLGALKGSLVGQSEENIRRALRLADAMGRVVLWIDELGKAVAGAQGPAGDSGVAADALGEMLFWMQEHEGEALIVATTNETDLPPELIRRFDATFFVDLPNRDEREAILAVALRSAGRDPEDFALGEVAAVSSGFSGDELTKLVQSGLLSVWGSKQRKLTASHLISAAASVVPMSRSSAEKIDAMRRWAQGRAMPASLPAAEERAPKRQR